MKVTNIEDHHKRKMVILLKKINVFNFFKDNDFDILLNRAKLQSYKLNEIVIEEGDYNNFIFFLISGSLSVFKNDKQIASLNQEGELFGEMGVLNNDTRSARVKADKNSLILCIDATILKSKGSKDEIMFNYILYRLFSEILAKRLRRISDTNVLLMSENDILKQELLRRL